MRLDSTMSVTMHDYDSQGHDIRGLITRVDDDDVCISWADGDYSRYPRVSVETMIETGSMSLHDPAEHKGEGTNK